MGMCTEHMVVTIVLIVHAQLRMHVYGGMVEAKRGQARFGAIKQKEQGRGHKQLRKA